MCQSCEDRVSEHAGIGKLQRQNNLEWNASISLRSGSSTSFGIGVYVPDMPQVGDMTKLYSVSVWCFFGGSLE